MWHDSILGAIGNTPLVRLGRIAAGIPCTVLGKIEFLNPGGSVKDRAAFRMIEDAESSGRLTRDRTILDSSSGNTGIAYAMIGAVKGYRVKIVIPESASSERRMASPGIAKVSRFVFIAYIFG